MMPYHLLSVPHAEVDLMYDEGQHTADFTAEQIAKEMLNSISGESVLIIGDVNREILDLNRIQSRGSIYRRTLRQLMKKDCVVVVDVHSFPGDSRQYRGKEVAFVSPFEYPNELESFLIDKMDMAGIQIGFVGNEKADVYLEATEKGIPVVLIEFNERLSSDRTQEIIEIFCRNLCVFFSKVVK